MTNCSRIVVLWYLCCLIVGCIYNLYNYLAYNKEIKYIIISIIIFILILLLIIKINKCYYKKTKINYSNDYKQKLNEIAETYINKLSYLHNSSILQFIKLKNEDISVLVEIKLKENSNTTIEQLWTETEQELKDTIHNLFKNKQNLEYTRKNDLDDLENQVKQLRKQLLINNLKQQGKRKTPIIKQEEKDLISFV